MVSSTLWHFVTSPHALPSELHGQPDFKTVYI